MRLPSTVLIGVLSFVIAAGSALALRALQSSDATTVPAAGTSASDIGSGAAISQSPAGEDPAGSSPWDDSYFPNVPLVGHDGKVYRFYDDLVRDKIVVVNFIYTSCSNICPVVTARMAQVKDKLGDRVGKDIFFLSITIDPVRDGPEIIKQYAETYRAGPGWLFLTGEPHDIDAVRHKLGERSRTLNEHRSDVILGNDKLRDWGRDSAFQDTDLLAETIRRLDPAHQDKPRMPGSLAVANTLYDLSKTPGKGLFIKACSGCHSIGYGNIIGPDLAGVMERRDRAWLKRYLIEPDVMRAEGDKLAVELGAQFPNVDMPALGLSPNDAEDLMTYLGSKTGVASALPANPANQPAINKE